MADRHGLRALEMRVARHRRLRLGLGPFEHGLRERGDRRAGLGARIGDVEPERGRDLVVAGAAGVDLPPDLAEQPLDRAVDVLVLGTQWHRATGDLGEPRLRLGELAVVQQARRVQPPRVHGRCLAVVGQELGVVRTEERAHRRIERAADAPAPERHASVFARARAAASSTSNEEILMNPSAAACGNVSPVP